jgi:hypothetical protein
LEIGPTDAAAADKEEADEIAPGYNAVATDVKTEPEIETGTGTGAIAPDETGDVAVEAEGEAETESDAVVEEAAIEVGA